MHDPAIHPTWNRIIDDIEKWQGNVDREIKKAIRRLPQLDERPTSCHTCTTPACCSQSIFEPFYAALPVARHLRTTGQDTPEMRERLERVGRAMEGTPRDDWFRQRHDCVFLKEKRCSIYQIRPMACRGYFVVSPAELCQNDVEDLVSVVNMEGFVEENIQMSHAASAEIGLKQSKQRIYVGSFPRMVYLALRFLEMSPGAGLAYLRLQTWPTEKTLPGWIHDGQNPYNLAQRPVGDPV